MNEGLWDMALKNIKLAGIVGLAALTGGATLSAQQSLIDEASDPADSAIRVIDPTTGEASPVIDPDLPELSSAPDFDEVTHNTVPGDTSEPPRGPAARMISQPQVQAVPQTQPTLPQVASSDDPFVIKSILPVEGAIRYGEWFWDESAAPSSGKLVVTVDLDARVISVFRDGHEIGTAVALLGTTSHPTPLGTFPILTKERDNVSEKYNNAPMPWTLRLTWDGIAIHGSPVMNGYASHGCIGVPDPFAEKLFAIAKRGDKVVITRGKLIGMGDRIMS
ncbi:MAG: L,D-transpeptidase family protein [Erythrobacter sp.]